jgi:hypothetical protein
MAGGSSSPAKAGARFLEAGAAGPRPSPGNDLAQHHLMAEIEADAAVAGPADEGVDSAAFGEFDDHRLAQPRRQAAFDHRAPGRDVEHRHRMALAAEEDDGACRSGLRGGVPSGGLRSSAPDAVRASHSPSLLWGGAECTIVAGKSISGSGDRPQGPATMWIARRALPDPVGSGRARASRPARFRLDRRAARHAARARHQGDRRPSPPRLGARYTDLLDPDFPKKLGDYAARVAERYPWIEMWTPVNEPLTTARFSGLYGHWYPHGRDYPPSFARWSTSAGHARGDARDPHGQSRRAAHPDRGSRQDLLDRAARYQAAHENERRWLSFDLLCGRVDAAIPWRRFLLDAGIGEASWPVRRRRGRPDLSASTII